MGMGALRWDWGQWGGNRVSNRDQAVLRGGRHQAGLARPAIGVGELRSPFGAGWGSHGRPLLALQLKWCAWIAVYCSFISFANSRSSEDTKQMMSSFM